MNYYKTTNSPDFNGLSINVGTYGKLECYEDILLHIQNRFKLMTWKHNKVLFVRFDLHFPYGYACVANNTEISNFIKLLKEYYTRHDMDSHYLWVREQSSTNNIPHYHIVALFDGNKIQNYYPVVERAGLIWSRIVRSDERGLVNYCHVNYQMSDIDAIVLSGHPWR